MMLKLNIVKVSKKFSWVRKLIVIRILGVYLRSPQLLFGTLFDMANIKHIMTTHIQNV